MRQFASHKFLRQKPIDNYIVDFYCSELRLVIEIDGVSHAETVEYDAERTMVLQALGLVVVRYTNDDVIQNIQGVYDDLSERIEKLISLQHPTPLAPLVRGGLKTCLSPSPDKGRAGEGFDGLSR
jgi:very-short-patch-repair endonuclease